MKKITLCLLGLCLFVSALLVAQATGNLNVDLNQTFLGTAWRQILGYIQDNWYRPYRLGSAWELIQCHIIGAKTIVKLLFEIVVAHWLLSYLAFIGLGTHMHLVYRYAPTKMPIATRETRSFCASIHGRAFLFFCLFQAFVLYGRDIRGLQLIEIVNAELVVLCQLILLFGICMIPILGRIAIESLKRKLRPTTTS